MKRTIAVLLIATVAVISAPPAVAVAAKNPYGTATVDPAAPNEIILTISKGSKKVDFAYPRLAKMKQSTISIYEPFLKKRQTFTVIRLQSLFNLAGISGDDKVVTKALNDYVFSSSAKNFIDAGAYLAIKRNGIPIGYDQGGPIRIVYGDESKWAKNLDAWNWSLESIRVK
jgi:hypothetical protein